MQVEEDIQFEEDIRAPPLPSLRRTIHRRFTADLRGSDFRAIRFKA
jgi:hypothetical protein